MFKLDDRLANDTIELGNLGFTKILMCKDSNYPWVILVPEIANATEIHQLTPQQQTELMQTITFIAQNMETEFKADKINIAALGNVVKQLHIHVVARYEQDLAWPGPIWGKHPMQQYNEIAMEEMALKFKKLFNLG